jgi:hypothetical protein
MHDELAVRALDALIDDHLCPSGLEVHVLPNLEFRLGWSRVDMRCAVFHHLDAHDGVAGSTGVFRGLAARCAFGHTSRSRPSAKDEL